MLLRLNGSDFGDPVPAAIDAAASVPGSGICPGWNIAADLGETSAIACGSGGGEIGLTVAVIVIVDVVELPDCLRECECDFPERGDDNDGGGGSFDGPSFPRLK